MIYGKNSNCEKFFLSSVITLDWLLFKSVSFHISLTYLYIILLLLYGILMLLIFVRSLTPNLQQHLLLPCLQQNRKNFEPISVAGLFLFSFLLARPHWTDISGTNLSMDSSLSTFYLFWSCLRTSRHTNLFYFCRHF